MAAGDNSDAGSDVPSALAVVKMNSEIAKTADYTITSA